MPEIITTLSPRIPTDLKAGLEQLAAQTQRSRNYHSVKALSRYLGEYRQADTAAASVYDIALRYSGIAQETGATPRPIAEIDSLIRDLRDDG